MPGIKKPDPEAAFWGFDKHYFDADLGYAGPEFGWFNIPDQFTLRQFSAHELTPEHAPLFAQIVLVSSHTPFAPVPPYLADWSDAGDYKTVSDSDWKRIYAPPDWNDLDQPYLDSIAYDLKTLGAWLKGLDHDALVIILGDHQPPEITRVAGQPWTVPVYVLSRDADLVEPFAALGYAPGDTPPSRDHPEGMEKFLDEFLGAFSVAPPCLSLFRTTPRRWICASPVLRGRQHSLQRRRKTLTFRRCPNRNADQGDRAARRRACAGRRLRLRAACAKVARARSPLPISMATKFVAEGSALRPRLSASAA